jgi:CHASE2 domain-containing sensor protein
MKRRLLDSLFIVLITLLLAFTANRAMNLWVLRLAFPETFALDDVSWEDFSFKLRPNPQREERIVLVNIATGGRREIAQQIMQVSRLKPRVIGIDVFFNCTKGKRDSIHCPQLLDTLGNLMLAEAIKEAGNVVMVSRLEQTKNLIQHSDESIYDSLELSDEEFIKYATTGFGDLPVHSSIRETTDSDIPIHEIREITPARTVSGKTELFFGVRLAWLYDSIVTQRFLKRNRSYEWISYRGSVNPYHYDLGSRVIKKPAYLRAIDIDSLANGFYTEKDFKDKIVLIGFLGDYLNDPAFESRFYTPLNPTFAGRSMPDMLGLPIMANVISMILNEDYINEASVFLTWLVSFIVLILNVQLFIWLYRRQNVWYDSLCFIIPVLQIVVYSWLRLELLAEFNFRMEFEGIIYLIAFVSFSVNLYFGPLLSLIKRKSRVNSSTP